MLVVVTVAHAAARVCAQPVFGVHAQLQAEPPSGLIARQPPALAVASKPTRPAALRRARTRIAASAATVSDVDTTDATLRNPDVAGVAQHVTQRARYRPQQKLRQQSSRW
jgi:hypothetical protein